MLDIGKHIREHEEEKRGDFIEEMFSGQTKASDKSFKFNLAPWKDRFKGMPVLFMLPGVEIKVRYKSRFNINRGHIQPLGAGLLGTILKYAGCEVKILDLPVERMLNPDFTDEELLTYIGRFKPKFMAMSVWSPTAAAAFELADTVKSRYPDIPLVFGGPHLTSFPEATLRRYQSIDIVAEGEGEATILELAEHFDKGEPTLKNILGIGYRVNGEPVFNASRPRLDDLNDLPLVDRSLFKLEGYLPLPQRYKRLPTANLVTSRGCPYACTFCFEAGRFGLKFRAQSVERVIEEIQYLQREYGVKEINFWDDIFLVNKKWIYAFCDAIEKENINISWTCESRVDHVNPELLQRIAKAGCYSIFYGFEAGTDELLEDMEKGTTVEQNRQAAIWTEEAGIAIRASFILGLPTETPEMGQKTIDFALSLPGLDALTFSFATPHPGTELFNQVKDEINVDEDDYIHELSKYTQWELTYVAPGYKGQEHKLFEMRQKAYRKFYFNPKYISRQLMKIRSFSDIARYYQGLKLAIGVSV
ncbi:MAG: radical SAM protein [Nitrospinota bacterium]|nr:radical SAM protein [Nitrospinota bacterium]